jgi:hypothetical protein
MIDEKRLEGMLSAADVAKRMDAKGSTLAMTWTVAFAQDIETLVADLRVARAEIDTLRALNEHATRERERQACEIGRLSANGIMVVAMLDKIIKYAREDGAKTPGSTRLARALAKGFV